MHSPELDASLDTALEFETEQAPDHPDHQSCLGEIRMLKRHVTRLAIQLDQEKQRNQDLSAHLDTSLDRIEALLEENDKKSDDLKKLSEEMARLKEDHATSVYTAGTVEELGKFTGYAWAEIIGGTTSTQQAAGGDDTMLAPEVQLHDAVTFSRPDKEEVGTSSITAAAELEGSYPPHYIRDAPPPATRPATPLNWSGPPSDSPDSSGSSAYSSDLDNPYIAAIQDHKVRVVLNQRVVEKFNSYLRRQKRREARSM